MTRVFALYFDNYPTPADLSDSYAKTRDMLPVGCEVRDLIDRCERDGMILFGAIDLKRRWLGLRKEWRCDVYASLGRIVRRLDGHYQTISVA